MTSLKEILPAEALSSGTDLSMAKRELEVLRDAQEAASHRVKVLMGCMEWEMLPFLPFQASLSTGLGVGERAA